MTMMMMKMVMMFDGSPSRTRAPSPYKLDPFTPTSRKSTLALRYDTIRTPSSPPHASLPTP